MEESFKYHIPEDIPANERTAFHGAAAAAAKDGKKNFNFGGKTHPVTMKKDTAKAIADQKESMTFREKLMSLYEGDRAAHYKSATKPEEYDEKQKSSKGAMDMMKTPKSVEADGMKAAKDTADAIKKSAPGKKMRKGDQNKGDLSIKPSATPVKDPSAKIITAEEYGMFGKKINKNLLDAVAMVEDMNKIHTVDIDHTTGKAGSHEKKHGITIKKNPKAGPMAVDATGTKANLQKYLKKHYDGDHKAMHPEIYKETAMQSNNPLSKNLLDAVNQVTNEDVSYHKAMKNAHNTHSYAHENEVTNDGHSDHDYAGNEHGEAANHHQKAIDAHKKHGGDSSEYKKAAAAAHKQTAVAHDSSKDAGKFKKTAKPGTTFPKKPN